MHGAHRLVPVGDHKQLRPIILKAKVVKKASLANTLFGKVVAIIYLLVKGKNFPWAELVRNQYTDKAIQKGNSGQPMFKLKSTGKGPNQSRQITTSQLMVELAKCPLRKHVNWHSQRKQTTQF